MKQCWSYNKSKVIESHVFALTDNIYQAMKRAFDNRISSSLSSRKYDLDKRLNIIASLVDQSLLVSG